MTVLTMMKRVKAPLISILLSSPFGVHHGPLDAKLVTLTAFAMFPVSAVSDPQCDADGDDEVCKSFWHDSSRWKKVTMGNIAAADWQIKLRNLQNQAKIDVCGPQPYATVSKDRLENAFKDISALPSLQHLMVDPNYGREVKDQVVLPSYVSSLLSQADKLETLSIRDLDIHDDADVHQLALAFSECTSLKSLQINYIDIASRDIESLLPLMRALAEMPNLTRLHLVLNAFGDEEQTVRYAKESLPALQDAPGLSDMDLTQYEEGFYRKGAPELKYRILSNWDKAYPKKVRKSW